MQPPVDFAAAVAPEVDRCRLAVALGLRDASAQLARDHGLDGPAGYVFSMLRNTMPDRVVAADDVRRLFIYDPAVHDHALPELVALDLVTAEQGSVALTPSGRALMARLHDVAAEVADSLWLDQVGEVEVVVGLIQRALTSTPPQGGGYAVLAPVFTPDGASPCAVLAEQLSALRFHRFDAHVDAWVSRGLTAQGVRELDDESLRAEIEADTNVRNAALWSVLGPGERDRVLEVLRTLPAPSG